LIDLSLRDKIWKKSKIIAIVIVVFWLLIVSINAKRIFNVSDYVADESSNLSTSQLSESQIGNNIISNYNEKNSSFQIIVHNPDGDILTNESKSIITQLINNITQNPKIGPILSPKTPYSSVFDDADNLLRSILSLQWFATQFTFASIHFIWEGLDYFSLNWIDQYNLTNDLELATSLAIQFTSFYIQQFLDTRNESRYFSLANVFLDEFATNFILEANDSIPVSQEETYSLSKSIISSNESFFRDIAKDNRDLQILTSIASEINDSKLGDEDYLYNRISQFLFNRTDISSVDFVKEVYSNGDIEGYVRAKNKYLLPVLRKEIILPPLSEEIVNTFLKQYTDYSSDNQTVHTTILLFNLALSHNFEEGKAAYLELLEILPLLKNQYTPFEIYATGIDMFVVELSLDYEKQLHRTDLIVIITIIVILILVYRSPLLPLIQMFVLAIAFGISRLTFIFIGSRIGGLSNTSLIVLSVSLLGATTDYCVFLMGDYLLNLKKKNSREEALRTTLKRTSKSIVISSISLTVGFGALVLSSFAMATGMGIGGMIGFLTSMVVSLTLIPAVLILVNDKYLTKWRFSFKKLKLPKISLAKGVRKSVRNPKFVLVAALVFALIGTGIFLITPTDYAQISTAPTSYHSRQGLDSVSNYLGTEYISQITLLFQTPETDKFLYSNSSLNFNSLQHVLFIMQELQEAANITQIVGLSHPLGKPFTESLQNTSLFVSEEIFILMKNFILPDESLGVVYLGSQYMEGDERLNNQVVTIRETVQLLMEEREISEWSVYVTGFASQMHDSKEMIKHDFNLIFAFTCATIAILLFIFLKDFFMSIRVLATILVSLGFSLGIFAILALIFFGGSIYWMVPLMLYAVLTALGLDFDVLFLGIFLNIYEETKDKQKAIVNAVDQTMSNISVAGIIMAATYLSLVFTSSIHMQQLGLGLGIGILVDVFVSRLFIVPPAVVVSFRPKEERKKKKGEVNDERGKK